MSCILESFFPDIFVKSVYELPLEELSKRGIRGLVFDIDNTLVPFDKAEPDDALVDLFSYFRQEGFQVCILSNNNHRRVQLFNRRLGVHAIFRARKPGIARLKKALSHMGLEPHCTAIIGDQVFTDMLCGHRAGLYCIMTATICNKDQWVTKIKRGMERKVMNIFWRKYPKGRKNA